MEMTTLLNKLLEIEQAIGVEDNAALRKKILEAQDCILRVREVPAESGCLEMAFPDSFEDSWNGRWTDSFSVERHSISRIRGIDRVRLSWRRFLKAYAPEFATSITDDSESQSFSGGWGAPRR
jgi:hypothetical protein